MLVPCSCLVHAVLHNIDMLYLHNLSILHKNSLDNALMFMHWNTNLNGRNRYSLYNVNLTVHMYIVATHRQTCSNRRTNRNKVTKTVKAKFQD